MCNELELMGQQLSYDAMREIGESYDPTAAKQLMDGMYQKALDACRNESEREEVHPLTLAKLEDFGILCKEGKDYAPTHAYRLLIFIRKSIIVPDQPSGLPVGVSGEAGFLRTITDFVRRKSYTSYKTERQEY